MPRTKSRIQTGIFLRKPEVSKIRKILGSFENVGPGSKAEHFGIAVEGFFTGSMGVLSSTQLWQSTTEKVNNGTIE